MNRLIKKCKWEAAVFAAAAVVILFFWNSMYGKAATLYMAECTGLALYLVIMEVPGYRLRQKENKLYKELLVFFSRVKHRYMASHHIGNAMLAAAENMSYEIQRLAEEIYYLLLEGKRKETVRHYIEHHTANRFMKMFLIQVYEISEKGDQNFAENIEYLRLELMEELYRRRKREYEFSGYVFVAVTPFFMMPLLEQWGKQFASEMVSFYSGTGMLLETVIFCVTLLIYGVIVKAKELTSLEIRTEQHLLDLECFFATKAAGAAIRSLDKSDGCVSNYIRRLILRSGEKVSYGRFCFRILVGTIGIFLVISCFLAGLHQKEKREILSVADGLESVLPTAGEEKREKIKEHMLAVTAQCIELENVTEEQIRILLREKIQLHNDGMEQAVIKEIQEKLIRYSKAGTSVREWMVCVIISIGVGVFPVIKLWYQGIIIRSGAVNEVRLFQSLILMERKLPQVTIVSLLEDMEAFSVCFRECISRCINSYGSNPQRALLRLKEEGTALHEGFEELADAFLSVDDVGIEAAFAEVESNRRLLEKMTQLEAEIRMEKKKDTTDLLAKIPGVLVVGVYFILPVFWYSLKGVYEVFELLEEMQL